MSWWRRLSAHRGHGVGQLGIPVEEVVEAGEDAQHAVDISVLPAQGHHAEQAAAGLPTRRRGHRAFMMLPFMPARIVKTSAPDRRLEVGVGIE